MNWMAGYFPDCEKFDRGIPFLLDKNIAICIESLLSYFFVFNID
jgi:hypothetical protein